MTYIFFIASFNAFFFLGLLLRKQPKANHDKILQFWLIYLGVSTALYGLTMNLFEEMPLLTTGVISTFLLHGPFMYLYVSYLTSENKPFGWLKLLHFSPFILFILYLIVASQLPEYSKGISLDHYADLPAPPMLFVLFLITTALSGPLYFILTFRKYKELKKSTESFSSKDINMEWLGKLITIFGIVWTIFIIVAVVHHVFHFFTMMFCTNGLFLSLSAFVILIGYYGLNQREVFINLMPFVDNEEDVKVHKEIERIKPDVENGEYYVLEEMYNDVLGFMLKEQPYLDPELTLPKLAKEVGIPAHQLSQIINEFHKDNFFNFINQYRVEEVKSKMQDEKFENYSLLAIAFDSGFNSKSAFNRVFKKMTQMTPSQYKMSISV